MVVDYEDNKVMFKDEPTVWHPLPTTKKGLIMVPLTKEACERHRMETPPPPTKHNYARKEKKKRSLSVVVSVKGVRVCHPDPENRRGAATGGFCSRAHTTLTSSQSNMADERT